MTHFLARHASGSSMTRIAIEEHYAYSTVRNTLDEARMRLGARNLASACMIAHSLGWLSGPTGAEMAVLPVTA